MPRSAEQRMYRRCGVVRPRRGSERQRIFISYRRSESLVYAQLVHDRLVPGFGAENVFLDTAKILPGEPFPSRIEEEIRAADDVLLLIGPTWLSITGDDGQQRLADPADWVRREIEIAR